MNYDMSNHDYALSTLVTVYDPETGRIVNNMDMCMTDFILYAVDGPPVPWLPGMVMPVTDWIIGNANPATHYVVNEQAVERPTCPAVLNGTTLENVPFPSKLTINGTEYEVDDDTVTLDGLDIGTYKLTLKCWPYLDGNYEVEA